MNTQREIKTSPVNPLDTLLVQQLTKLIAEESSLATKYPALNSLNESTEARVAFSQSLAQLERQADRLQRMVNAMESAGFSQSVFSGRRVFTA